MRHSLSAAATYDIPNWNKYRSLVPFLHSWAIDALMRLNSAAPVNPIVGGRALFGLFGSTRPDLVADTPLYVNDPTVAGGRRINRAAFAFPPAGQQGTLGRNVLRGFPVSQLDLAVRRVFGVSERWKLQLRADVFNVFNHPNFGAPVARVNNPNFGRSDSMLNNSLGFDGGLNPLYQIGGPRSDTARCETADLMEASTVINSSRVARWKRKGAAFSCWRLFIYRSRSGSNRGETGRTTAGGRSNTPTYKALPSLRLLNQE